MDGIGRDESRPWASWGDLVVVLTALLLGLLGLIRHVRADEGGLQSLTGFDQAFLAAMQAPEAMIAAASTPAPLVASSLVSDAGVPDAVVPVPEEIVGGDCCPRSCDRRICHVLDPWGEDPLWSGRAEALLLWRSNPQGLPLFDFANSGGQRLGPALNAADLGSGMAAGPRFTLFRHTGDQGAIEFNYLRVQSFTAEKTLPTDAKYLPVSPDGIYCCPYDNPPVDMVSGNLSGAFQSFELNRRFPTDGRWQWLTGFRWVQWQEKVLLTTDYRGQPPTFTELYNTSVCNDLYGWQFGADSILFGLGRPFRIEGLGKAGVFYNNANQNSSLRTTYVPGGVDFTGVATHADRTAFVGEVGLTAVYDVFDWLSLRAGYAAFWLGGIATATNQLDQQCLCSDPLIGRTDTGGSVVVQGITLGLEARY